ncbi:MAG: hypothetical protein ACI9TV_001873 [Sulfurimonas sp.]|jgi:hypothetical protein|uniref:hypothetical protein n=1 Tax=Sulfurimonas sp. TaxID=2022749 RepID=UPI0039E6BF1F
MNKLNIEPLFNFDSNQNSFLLHKGKAKITVKDELYRGSGEAKLELQPSASIIFNAEFENVSPIHIMNDMFGETSTNIFSLDDHKIDGFNMGDSSEQSTWKMKWRARSEPTKLQLFKNEETKKIIFHLFNFNDFHSESFSTETHENTPKHISYFTLLWKTYKITIKSLYSTRDSVQILKNEGGYRLTQVGSIEKSDDSMFTENEQISLLEGLRYFISFAKGSWCGPVCPVGFNTSNKEIWYSFNSPNKQWQSPFSWFDTMHASQLEELFPLFMNLWEKDNWKTTIKEIIYWYLNANDSSRGIDAGLILTQAALERLSFEYVVNEKKLLSAKGFKDIWASDKFRLLFSSLDIPIKIDESLINFTKSAKEYSWLDIPHGLTEIRNSLIHPEHKKHGKITTSLFLEAWNISLWYLEMSLLAICGYSGTYANRLTVQRYVGTVEKVPYNKERDGVNVSL